MSDSLSALLDQIKLDGGTNVEDLLVIGIDFGTTFSGVAWATVEDLEQQGINLIRSWPGSGREVGKAPTELFYEDGQVMWGFDVPRDGDPIRWFKLLLLKDEDIEPEIRSSEYFLRARRTLKENNETAISVISDYLRCLWNHTIETIEADRGKSVVDALECRVVITVPAIWKSYARQAMREAAHRAGILERRPAGDTRLVFAPEPEAAALSTLCEKGRKPRCGDVYVVCDAGGGTVDLISYEICDVNPIRLREAAEGAGALCGGIFIDEAFERICKARLGRRWDRLSKVGVKDIMKGEWEYAIKPQFKRDHAKTAKEYVVGIPAEAFVGSDIYDDSREPHIKNGRIHFNGLHIEGAFTETVSNIAEQIDKQISKSSDRGKAVTGVILVGGLGASPYLHEYLKERYSSEGINVLQPRGEAPRTAICRGAIIKGLLTEVANGFAAPATVVSTIPRTSIGVSLYRNWIDGKFLEEDKRWSDREGRYIADNQMDWYIVRGEAATPLKPVRAGYRQLHEKDFGGIFRIRILECEDEEAPPRVTDSVKKLCTIECKLDMPFSLLPDFVNPRGKRLKTIAYEVEAIPSGASVEFAVYVDGRRLGAQNVDMKF